MTGAELAADLDALLASNPRLSKPRIGVLLHSHRAGVERIRAAKFLHAKTIAKARAIIANPPPEAYKGYRGPRRACSSEANERRKASIRRSVSRKARALIAGDESILTTGGRVNQTIATAMVAIRATMEAERRATDPIEQALLKIRRSRRIIYRASVHGGPPDRFYVSGKGKETIGIPELLKMAEAA